jgi:serine O-acetyltransferase
MSTLRGSDFLQDRFAAHRACTGCPSPAKVAGFHDGLLALLFPEVANQAFGSLDDFERHADRLERDLEALVARVPGMSTEPRTIVASFFEAVPGIFARLEQDVTATYECDPAATSRGEVVRSYPGFFAIAAYRVAHALHVMGLPLLPRMITEHAHARTGIDIHPGAVIGARFCIDHGTGVVIGETAEVGDGVKMYQGVTLGGLSVRKQDARTKRHPTIEDDVVLYAGATILGGATRIGRGSVIGGNVWLTRSVPPYTTVSYQPHMRAAARGAAGDAGESDVLVERQGEPWT